MRTQILELVRTIELDPIEMSGAPLRFRIEVLRETRDPHLFFARLFRWETFEMNPWPTDVDQRTTTQDLLIADPFWDWRENPTDSESAAVELVLARLASQLPGITFD